MLDCGLIALICFIAFNGLLCVVVYVFCVLLLKVFVNAFWLLCCCGWFDSCGSVLDLRVPFWVCTNFIRVFVLLGLNARLFIWIDF